MATTLSTRFARIGSERASLIRKALNTGANVGLPLIRENLERIITNLVVRLVPEFYLVQKGAEYGPMKTHEFTRLNQLPDAGGAIGESGTTPTTNSRYERLTVELKEVRRKGMVTMFLQDASKNFIDARAAEMENHLIAQVYDLAAYTLYGNAEADQFTYSGLDTFITTERTHLAEADAVFTSVSVLDEMIDANQRRQGSGHDQAFLVSPEMQSRISRELVDGSGSILQIHRNISDAMFTTEGGVRMMSYRGIPLIPTSGVRPQIQMGTVATATATSGGTIAADEYFFYVAPVTRNGEELASTVASQVTTGTTSTITLTWTAIEDAYYYKIYVGTTTGPFNASPTRIISAKTYDSAGTPTGDVTGYTFTSPPTTRDTTVTASQNTNDHPYAQVGGVSPEAIILWDLDKYQGLGKFAYTNDEGGRFDGLVTMHNLAITDAFIPFLIRTIGALVPSWEATSVMRRGVRVA